VEATVGQPITFPVFDVFSYLIVGLMLIATCELIFGRDEFFHLKWGFGSTTMVVIAAYVLGHIVTFASGVATERLVQSWLMLPTANLMQAKQSNALPSQPSARGNTQNQPPANNQQQTLCQNVKWFFAKLGSDLISHYTDPLEPII
jgi:hypothetical protein